MSLQCSASSTRRIGYCSGTVIHSVSTVILHLFSVCKEVNQQLLTVCMTAGNWGVHVVIPKWAFTDIEDTSTSYVPVTVSGTSTLLNETMPMVPVVATAG